jgi:four helix bundle protein
MGNISRFEDLRVWQAAREIVNAIYQITQRDALSKDVVLVKQVRRSAISIMSNIAEGYESASDKKFANYVNIAKSSAGECRAQIYIASDQQYINNKQSVEILNKLTSISKQLSKLESYLRKENLSPNQTKDYELPYNT